MFASPSSATIRPAIFSWTVLTSSVVGDVEVLPQDVHARAIPGAAAVRRTAAVERQRVLARDRAQEFVDEARLADSGFADDDRETAGAAVRDLVESIQELARARRRAP